MKIEPLSNNGALIAVVTAPSSSICDGQRALDFLMTVQYETGTHYIIVNKEALPEEFFRLSTGIAGDVLQKIVNYRFKVAFVGDYSGYTSRPLKDFFYEINRGNDLYFGPTLEDALDRFDGLL